MVDSKIEWIGLIPDSWSLKPIQFTLREINVKNSPVKTDQVLSLVKDKGVMLYEEKGNQGNKAKEDVSQYKLAYPGTLVVNSMNILIGSVGISDYFGCVSPVYYVFTDTDKSDIRFVGYIFQTREFQKELRKYANGILEIRMRVSTYDIFKRKIPVPSKEQQTKIANYLDKICSSLDSTCNEIEDQIERLKDYRRSVITHATTKGLASNVGMRDSGIDWVGEIPSHWEIKKLKFVSKVRDEKLTSNSGNDYFALENLVSWTGKYEPTENVYDTKGSIKCKKGDVVFGKLRPYLAKVFLVDFDRCCSSEFATFYDFNGISKFYFYLLISQGFVNAVDMSTYGTKMPRANIEFIKNVKIPIPPVNEQIAIVDYLDKSCSKIDSWIDKKERLLASLRDYKKSLIYEYVTGKKEVPNE